MQAIALIIHKTIPPKSPEGREGGGGRVGRGGKGRRATV